MTDVDLTVGIGPQSQADLAKAIADALQTGGNLGVDALTKEFAKLNAALEKVFAKGFAKSGTTSAKSFVKAWEKEFVNAMPAIEREMTRSSHAMARVFSEDIADMQSGAQHMMKTVMSRAETMMSPRMLKRLDSLSPAQQRAMRDSMQTSRSGMWANVESTNVAMSAFGKMQAQEIASAGRLAVAQEKNAGKMLAIEARRAADQATNATRLAGERRLAIQKGIVKSLVMLERGVGAAIAGTARTITSAVSRLVSGTTSALSKMASGVGRMFQRSNSDMTTGLTESLNRRERIMRTSFTQQEQIVSRSTMRQQAELAKMQAASSKGVLGAVTGRGLGGGLAALGGGMAIGAWLKGGYQEAVNLNEQMNKTKVVFGESAASVVDFASNAVNAFGSTKAEALTAAANFGNLFRAVKLSEKQSAEMSTTLVQLAGDLSSFNNVPIDDAFAAIQSGLVGEQEPLRKFGVNISDATMRAKALEMGLYSGKGALDANTKAQAAYALIMEQTALAQGDFARTSEEGANAQRRAGKAAKELAATIMVSVMPIMTKAFNLMSDGFSKLTTLLSDKTSPALHVLKRALMGAAAGMAAVLAMKGIVEMFRLLGPAIKLTLSPLGVLLITFGIIGAAISVMMDRSKALRETIGILADKFAIVGAKIMEFIQPLRDGAGRVLDEYIIPAIDRLAKFLADNLVKAFDAVVSFIKNTAIPALKAFAGFVMNTIWPILKNVGLAIGAAFMTAVRAVQSFWSAVQPLLQPAIDGFKALGSAIGSLFGGDASKMGEGASSALGGIGSAIGNIVGKIGELLAPIATKVRDWFVGLFSPDKIRMYIKGILWFVEQVGYWVARIVTHPNFIKAVAVIAAAAVVLGFTLIKGIVRGIADNLPALRDMLGSVLKAALKGLWDNIGVVLVLGLIAAIVMAMRANVMKMVGAFRTMGQSAGGGFAAGFKESARSASGFLSSLIKGPAATQAQYGPQVGGAKAQALEASQLQRQLRAFGSTAVFDMGTTKGLQDARAEAKRLSDGLTDAQRSGLLLRDSIQNTAKAVSSLGAAAKLTFTGFRAAGAEFRTAFDPVRLQNALKGPGGADSFKPLTQNAYRALNAIRREASTAFGGVGEGLKTAAKVGQSSFDTLRVKGMYAMDAIKRESQTAFGGVVKGWQTAGKAITSAAETSVLKGMYAMDALRGSKIGQIGAAAGTAFSASFTRGMQAIKDGFAASMAAFRQLAVDEGVTVGQLFKEKVAKAASGALALAGGAATGYAAGKSGASAAGVGLSAVMSGVAATAATGNIALGAVTAGVTLLGGAFGAAAKKAEEFKKKVDEVARGFESDLNKALENGSIKLKEIVDGLVDLGDLAGSNTISEAFVKELGDDGLKVLADFGVNWNKTFVPIIKEGGSADQIKEKLTGAFADSIMASKEFRDRFGANWETIGKLMREEMLTGTVHIRDLYNTAGDVSNEMLDLVGANDQYLRDILFTAGDLNRATDIAAKGLEEAATKASFLSDPSQVVDASAWETYYDSVNTAAQGNKKAIEENKAVIDLLGQAWQTAVDAVADYALLGSGSSFQQAVDAALVQIDGLGPKIAQSLSSGATLTGQDPISAALRQDLDSLGADLTSVVQKGITDGTIMKPGDALQLTQGLLEAARAGLDPGSEAYNLITEKFNAALAALAPKIDEATIAAESEKMRIQIDEYMRTHPGVMPIEAEIRIKEKNLAFQGGTTGNRFGGTEIVTPTIKIPSTVTPPAAAKTKTDFIDTGKAANDGFAKGVSLYTWVVEAATRSMARAAVKAANKELNAHSPSRVFIGIGGDVAAGLAIGISDGTEDAAGAARSIVDAAVTAAVNAAQNGTAAVTAATAQLFSAMTGAETPTGTGGKAMGLSQVISDMTNAAQGLNTTFASSAQAVWDATSKPVKDRTAADLNLIGESASSLNPSDVVGASNLAAVIQVLESIRQYGMTLLGSGSTAGDVIAKVQRQIDVFMQNATALGFKAPDLTRIIDDMGLSQDDLAAFATQVADLSVVPTAPAGGVPANVLPSTSAQAIYARQAGAGMAASQSNVEITNQIYLPTGDPEANALAVANRQASLLWS